MAEDKEHDGVSKVTSFAVDPRVLVVEEGFNGRPINPEHVKTLAEAFANGATFPPIEVRVDDGAIVLIDGHHRHAAVMSLIAQGYDVATLDARHFRGNNVDRVMLMVTSQQGLPMTPLQLGVQYKRAVGFGWGVKQIAERIGKSGQHIKDCIALAETDTDVQQMVTNGQVSAAVALTTSKKLGKLAGAALLNDLTAATAAGKTKVTAKNATVKQVTISIIDAIRAEIESNGEKKAHKLCPKYEREIQYLRASGL